MRLLRQATFAVCLALGVGGFDTTTNAGSQPLTSLSAFEAMGLEQLQTLQVKLTYLGPQDEPIPTLAFTTAASHVDVTVFRPYRVLAGDTYVNDEMGHVQTFVVSTEELRKTIQAVRHVVDRKTAAEPEVPFLSVALSNATGPQVHVFETILTHAESQEFFIYLRGALEQNEDAQRTFQWWGCALALLPKEIPAKDVTTQVSVATGGVEWNGTTQHFECAATLTNTTTVFFHAPISLVVDTPNNWRLAYYHGTTCVTSPVGRQYLHVRTPGGGLWPKAKASVRLQFEGPDDEPLEFTTKVLAGSGER